MQRVGRDSPPSEKGRHLNKESIAGEQRDKVAELEDAFLRFFISGWVRTCYRPIPALQKMILCYLQTFATTITSRFRGYAIWVSKMNILTETLQWKPCRELNQCDLYCCMCAIYEWYMRTKKTTNRNFFVGSLLSFDTLIRRPPSIVYVDLLIRWDGKITHPRAERTGFC